MTDDRIIVVGAGPTGCTLALLLARQGISTTVVERRADPPAHPAAHVINARSFEIWHQASPALAEQIGALAMPAEDVGGVRWCCGLSTPPLGEIDVATDIGLRELLGTHSRFLISHIGQHLLMPVLWAAMEREPLVTFRRATAVDELRETDGRIEVAVRSLGGAPERFFARYLVGADGANSAIRQGAGIAMSGQTLTHVGSAFFHAPGLFGGRPRPLLAWIYAPRFCGALISHADDHYVLMTPYLHRGQAVARDADNFWARTLPDVVGRRQPFTVRSTGTWTMTSQIAARFRQGPLLLAGDAAHRFPPAGGFGLNSGVQDAQNLAWKIAAIVRGRASDALLDTYEAERRPVVELFAQQSVRNFVRLDDVTARVGISNQAICSATSAVARPPASWLPGRLLGWSLDRATRLQFRRTKVLLAGNARSRRLRAQISAAVPSQREHFVFQGLEFGYTYRGPLIGGESGAAPGEQFDVVTYRPTTRPGSRLPHAMVRHEGGAVAVHDLLCAEGLTLLTASAPEWRAWLHGRDGRTGPIVTVVSLMAADESDQGGLLELFEVGREGAVLVRPDGHVAWRTDRTAGAASSALDTFLEQRWLPYWRQGQ